MVPKSNDWAERLNLDSKLPNFNTGRILVHESQAVNESLETSNTPKSSKDSEAEFLTPLLPLKNLYGASPSSKSIIKGSNLGTWTVDDQGCMTGVKKLSENILQQPGPKALLTRSMATKITTASASECLFANFLSKIEPKKVSEALKHPGWIDAMQEALNQFYRNKVRRREIDYDETFAPLARMEAIRIFLAFSTYINFKVYQIDVKSAILNGFDFKGYSDSDYAGCNMDRKSTSGACQILGGKLVCWSAKKQQSVAMSSAKAKYVVVAGCCAIILWMKSQLDDYNIYYKMSTAIAFNLFPSTNEPEKRPLKELLIKFSVLNGQRPLTFDFSTFCSSTGLNYDNGKYVDHPTPEVLGGNYSSTEQVNSIQQLLAYSLITGTEVDIREIIYSDLVTKLLNKCEASGALSKKRKKPKSKKPPTKTKVTPPKPIEGLEQSHLISSSIVPDPQDQERDIQLASMGLHSTFDEGLHRMAKTTSRPEGSLGYKDSEGNIPPADMEPIHTFVADPSGLAAKYQEVLAVDDDMDEDPHDDEEVRTPSPKQDQHDPSHRIPDKYDLSNIFALDSSNSACSHYRNVSKETARSRKSPSYGLPPINLSKLLIILLDLSFPMHESLAFDCYPVPASILSLVDIPS
ncbi:retrovirus-related pol polyprotein from transposon TNT 1-94 [Tanacetum coccineum]